MCLNVQNKPKTKAHLFPYLSNQLLRFAARDSHGLTNLSASQFPDATRSPTSRSPKPHSFDYLKPPFAVPNSNFSNRRCRVHCAQMDSKPKETKLWGGRFGESVTDAVEKFTESVSFDKALYKQDIMESRAHATMLAYQGLVSESDRDIIFNGLEEIKRRIEAGEFVWQADREDV